MLILASKSPRRKEILEKAGFSFTILETNADETADESLPVYDQAVGIARCKALSAMDICKKDNTENVTIIAADTIVHIKGKILTKPVNKEDAFNMLKILENKSHEVYTGLCVAFIKNGSVSYKENYCRTEVIFKPLTDRQITNYINTPEPYDKAGAYAIQGAAAAFIESINGDYDNVVGLPLSMLLEML